MSKWYKFLYEQEETTDTEQEKPPESEIFKTTTPPKEVEKKRTVDPIVNDEIAVFQIVIKAEFSRGSNVLLTQFKDIVRGILSVTTVGTQELPDPSILFDRRNLIIKFELERGENVQLYMQNILVPELRKIRGMRILHYGKVERIR